MDSFHGKFEAIFKKTVELGVKLLVQSREIWDVKGHNMAVLNRLNSELTNQIELFAIYLGYHLVYF